MELVRNSAEYSATYFTGQLNCLLACIYSLSHPFPFDYNYTRRRVKWGEHETFATLAPFLNNSNPIYIPEDPS